MCLKKAQWEQGLGRTGLRQTSFCSSQGTFVVFSTTAYLGRSVELKGIPWKRHCERECSSHFSITDCEGLCKETLAHWQLHWQSPQDCRANRARLKTDDAGVWHPPF